MTVERHDILINVILKKSGDLSKTVKEITSLNDDVQTTTRTTTKWNEVNLKSNASINKSFDAYMKSGKIIAKNNKLYVGQTDIMTKKLSPAFAGFRMEMLGVMFFGMALQRVFGGLLKPTIDVLKITDLWTESLKILMMPIMLEILPLFLDFIEYLVNLPPEIKFSIGAFAILAYVLGTVFFNAGMLALGFDSLTTWLGKVALKLGLTTVPAIIGAVGAFAIFGATLMAVYYLWVNLLGPLTEDIVDFGKTISEATDASTKKIQYGFGELIGVAIEGLIPSLEGTMAAAIDEEKAFDKLTEGLSKFDKISIRVQKDKENMKTIFGDEITLVEELTEATEEEDDIYKNFDGTLKSLTENFEKNRKEMAESYDEILKENTAMGNLGGQLELVNDQMEPFISGLEQQQMKQNLLDGTMDTAIEKSGDFKDGLVELNTQVNTTVDSFVDLIAEVEKYNDTVLAVKTIQTNKATGGGGEAGPGFFEGLINWIKGALGFAEGGIVTRPTLAVVGEAGPEAIIPLSGGGGAGMGEVSITNNFYGITDKDAIIREINTSTRQELNSMMRR